jgi:hypothetical protein
MEMFVAVNVLSLNGSKRIPLISIFLINALIRSVCLSAILANLYFGCRGISTTESIVMFRLSLLTLIAETFV